MIEAGHSQPLRYTPRQALAWAALASTRHRERQAEFVALTAQANRAREADLKSLITALQAAGPIP